MDEVSKVLLAAAELLEGEGAWTQGAYARNASHSPVLSTDRRAVCWCARGALRHASERHPYAFDDAIAALEGVVHGFVATWNDTPGRTQAEVVAALRKAAGQ